MVLNHVWAVLLHLYFIFTLWVSVSSSVLSGSLSSFLFITQIFLFALCIYEIYYIVLSFVFLVRSNKVRTSLYREHLTIKNSKLQLISSDSFIRLAKAFFLSWILTLANCLSTIIHWGKKHLFHLRYILCKQLHIRQFLRVEWVLFDGNVDVFNWKTRWDLL